MTSNVCNSSACFLHADVTSGSFQPVKRFHLLLPYLWAINVYPDFSVTRINIFKPPEPFWFLFWIVFCVREVHYCISPKHEACPKMFLPLKPFHFFLCMISPSLEFVVAPVHTSGHSTAIPGLERACGRACLLQCTLLRTLFTRDT